jgi:hypothetical protein
MNYTEKFLKFSFFGGFGRYFRGFLGVLVNIFLFFWATVYHVRKTEND